MLKMGYCRTIYSTTGYCECGDWHLLAGIITWQPTTEKTKDIHSSTDVVGCHFKLEENEVQDVLTRAFKVWNDFENGYIYGN